MASVEVSRFSCPACGFYLGFAAWDGLSASDEICSSCGIQFGYSDVAGGDPLARVALYKNWREKWIEDGMVWRGKGILPPEGWDPVKQLRNIGIILGGGEHGGN